MEILKCPVCGGRIELNEDEEKKIGVCPYCTYSVPIPTARDKKLKMYNFANEFRQNGEFDRARAIYENLLLENETEADAYWGMILCKYGIEYVDDPKTGKKIPTCHRASDKRIQDDKDFKLAIQYADSQKKELWIEEAQKLDQILSDIMAESAKQSDYDVFICYKESDYNGNRTEDSVLAHEIYDMLSNQGYKVFFAPKSIGLGQTYEPVIFAALRSAKLMFVIGTKAEYFEAPWVKNEWSRYMELIYTGREKTLIVLYKGVNPSLDLPADLQRRQGYNLDTLGYLQDISDAVKKIVGHKEGVSKGRNSNNAARNVAFRYVVQGDEKLKENDWISADEFYDKAIAVDQTCVKAWWGKLKVQTHNFEVGPWEPVYTPESQEYRAQVLQYADAQEAGVYRKILNEYEKSVSDLVVPKYRKKLDRLYEEEKEKLSDSEYVFQIDRQKMQEKMEVYREIYKSIERNSYKDNQAEVRKQYSQFEKYRDVFNGLLTKYIAGGSKTDEFSQKRFDLSNKREQCLQERWRITGGYSGCISCIMAIITAVLIIVMALFGSGNMEGPIVLAMLIELICFGVDISFNHMKDFGNITRTLMFFVAPLLLLIGAIAGSSYFIAQFDIGIDEQMMFLIVLNGVPAFIMAVDLYFNRKKYQKEKAAVKQLEEVEREYMSVKDEMIDQVNNLLDQAEQECELAKDYFLNREIIYKLINRFFF